MTAVYRARRLPEHVYWRRRAVVAATAAALVGIPAYAATSGDRAPAAGPQACPAVGEPIPTVWAADGGFCTDPEGVTRVVVVIRYDGCDVASWDLAGGVPGEPAVGPDRIGDGLCA